MVSVAPEDAVTPFNISVPPDVVPRYNLYPEAPAASGQVKVVRTLTLVAPSAGAVAVVQDGTVVGTVSLTIVSNIRYH